MALATGVGQLFPVAGTVSLGHLESDLAEPPAMEFVRSLVPNC